MQLTRSFYKIGQTKRMEGRRETKNPALGCTYPGYPSMGYASLPMDTTYQIGLPSVSQERSPGYEFRTHAPHTRAPHRPEPLQSTDETNSTFFTMEANRDPVWMEQSWNNSVPDTRPSCGPDQFPFPYEYWETDVEWRRPASSTAIAAHSESYSDYAPPADQYVPVSSSVFPFLSPRSSSQPPGRRIGRAQDGQRPSMLRQTTEASSIQRRYWNDSAFRGDADVLLFAEATFGLSPDDPRHPSAASPSTPDYFEATSTAQEQQREFPRPILQLHRQTMPEQLPRSTPDFTPTYYSAPYAPPRYSPDQDARQQTRELTGPARPRSFSMSPSDDDELPDYEQSQAEMHDRARREGVRRAQELQRRWREAHGY